MSSTAPSTSTAEGSTAQRSVALVTLGCTRNEVDSEELAGRLAAEGWTARRRRRRRRRRGGQHLRVRRAGQEGLDRHAARGLRPQGAPGRTKAVVAVGCLAERYGQQLADELPEADAVLGFDSYADMSAHLARSSTATRPPPTCPSDRRQLLPLSPAQRQGGSAGVALPGHGIPAPIRRHRSRCPPSRWTSPSTDRSPRRAARDPRAARRAPVGAAQDRQRLRPALRVLRDPDVPRVLRLPPAAPTSSPRRAGWGSGASRSCSSSARTPRPTARTSATSACSRSCCPSSRRSTGSSACGCRYLQPAEIRPGLLDAMASVPGVVPYFDLSFQHASATAAAPDAPVRRARGLPRAARARSARARRWPGSAATSSSASRARPRPTSTSSRTSSSAARLDVVGVFGYSDEDGTEAETYDDKLPDDVVAERVERFTGPGRGAHRQRAEERVGEPVEVLVERCRRRRRRRGAGGRGSGRAPGPGRRRRHDARPLPETAPGVAVGRHRRGPSSVGDRGRSTCVAEPCERVGAGDPDRGDRRRSARAGTEPSLEHRQRADLRRGSCSCRSSAGCCCSTVATRPASGGRRRRSSPSRRSPTGSTATSPGAAG